MARFENTRSRKIMYKAGEWPIWRKVYQNIPTVLCNKILIFKQSHLQTKWTFGQKWRPITNWPQIDAFRLVVCSFWLKIPFLLAPSKSETLGVLSRCKDDNDREVRKVEGSLKFCSLFWRLFSGSIVQSAVCRPAAMNLAYNNLKRSSFKAAQRVDRRVIQLGKNETPMGIR